MVISKVNMGRLPIKTWEQTRLNFLSSLKSRESREFSVISREIKNLEVFKTKVLKI